MQLNSNEENCFQKMKTLISSSDILIYPDFNKHYILTTDASNFAIGAVLSQGEIGKDRPIHFASRTLSKTEERYSATEKEMLAIFWALKTFRNYLYGAKFKLLTDHQPLTFSLSPRNTNAKLKRWKSYLEEHDFEPIYLPGKTNVVADALSRIVLSLTATQHSADNSDEFYIISTEAPLNAFRHQVVLKKGPDKVIVTKPFEGFTRITVFISDTNSASLLQVLKSHFNPSKVNGLLTDEETMGRLQEVYKEHFSQHRTLKIRFTQVLLEDVTEEDQQWNVIRETHNRAHRCVEENKLQILSKFYFPKLAQKLRDFVVNCTTCNECKYDRRPIKFPHQATPIPDAPFKIAHIDILFLENNRYLTYIDKFSKFAQIQPIDSRSSVDVSPAVKELLCKYKTPDVLVMDGEKSFMTGELAMFYNLHKIEPYIIATGRSEMNGIIERFHSTILEIYRITKTENPNFPVIDLLNMALHKYNQTIHSVTKFTPQQIILPSARSPEIIEKTFARLKSKQARDLAFFNKNKKPCELEPNSDAFETTRQRLKHKKRFKKIKIAQINKSTITTEDNRKIHKNDIKIRKI